MNLEPMSIDDWLKRHYPNFEDDSYESVNGSDTCLCPYCHGGEYGCKRCHYTGTRYAYNIVKEYRDQLKSDTVHKNKNKGTSGLPLFRKLNRQAA